MKTVLQSPRHIKDFVDPEIFLALKKLCKYVVEEAWNASTLGSDEGDAEYNLAIARTKRYKLDIKQLAEIDQDLSWGTVKKKTGEKSFVTIKKGNFNPWYEGELTLQKLLDSIADLVEIVESTEPRYILEAEFLHYYYFLNTKVPKKYPEPVIINIHSLHPKIQDSSNSLFNTAHYSQAILEAYKAVINEVKSVSGIKNIDGKSLIDKAFSLNMPVIKLNPLVSQSDKDEQQGFMLLFSGATVGIRNPKAHDLVVQQDKQRTLEYLSFASLLLERLDDREEPK